MSKFSGEAVAVYILLSDYSSVLNILIGPRFSCWTKQTNFETKIQTSYADSVKKVTQHSEARHLLLEGGGNQTPQSQKNDKQLQFLQCCIFRKAIHLSHINQVPQQRLWALPYQVHSEGLLTQVMSVTPKQTWGPKMKAAKFLLTAGYIWHSCSHFKQNFVFACLQLHQCNCLPLLKLKPAKLVNALTSFGFGLAFFHVKVPIFEGP